MFTLLNFKGLMWRPPLYGYLPPFYLSRYNHLLSTMASTKRSVKLSDVKSGQYYSGVLLLELRSSPAFNNDRITHGLNLGTSDTWRT